MDLTGKKIAILLEQQYQEMEVWYPYYRFVEAGASVDVVGPEAGAVYPSKLGYPAKSNIAAGKVKASDYDALIIPGGWAPDFMRRTPEMVNFCQQAVDADIVIGAICHGLWMLCSTNGLKGKTSTCFMAVKDDVINAGANYVDQECVVDGNLVSSRKPDDLPAFCQAIMQLLAG